jgi:DNA polymerase-3 subunit alpha
MERYRDVARRLGAASAAEAAGRPVASRVTLLGRVSQLKPSTTKSGNAMAFATLDMLDGSVALTVFPEPYKRCAASLRHPGAVLVKGRIDETEKGRVVLVEDAKPIEEAGNGWPAPSPEPAFEDPFAEGGGAGASGAGPNPAGPSAHTCRIRIAAAGRGPLEGTLDSVRAVCQAHRGRTLLFLHVLLDGHEVVVRARELSVEPAPEMVAEIERLLGPGSILVEYAGRA